MSDQDKPGENPGEDSAPDNSAPDKAVPENEMMREIRALHEQEMAAQKAEAARRDGKNGRGWKTAAGIGIGSAAVLAALLFAKRDKD